MEPGQPRQRAEVPAIDLDVSWLVPADLGAVDALARLQVTATRCGRSLQLHGACGGLPELLEFFGLVGVLHLCECCDPCAGDPGASTDV
jgi:ABC-type transporter Mla MlaB component